MEKTFYDEMVENVNQLDKEMSLPAKKVFLFGHCNATFELIDYLETKGISVSAILDNSQMKQVLEYKGVPVKHPKQILELAGEKPDLESVVMISSRFYASMVQQLRELGYEGPIRKVIDYNSYADYSLSDGTIARMHERVEHGDILLGDLLKKYPENFFVFCPFNALGDIYFMMSYWEAYAQKHGIGKCVFCVTGRSLADVIHMFGEYDAEIYRQKELDAMIQAALYTRRDDFFIAHQDRPYVVNLGKALYIKMIPLEKLYCCGVYGLPVDTEPQKPIMNAYIYKDIDRIPKEKSVIFSPYAKSIIPIGDKIWSAAVAFYSGVGYKCFTNVFGDERPLPGTEGISPSLLEMQSVVERAGTFVGIRSGLCDVIREAKAKKIALYPDYYYSDTKWKAIDMYYIDQFDYNLLATEEIEWATL